MNHLYPKREQAFQHDYEGSSSAVYNSSECNNVTQQQSLVDAQEEDTTEILLYPSRREIEAIVIPSCEQVFAEAADRKKRQQEEARRKQQEIEKQQALASKSFASCFLHQQRTVSSPYTKVRRREPRIPQEQQFTVTRRTAPTASLNHKLSLHHQHQRGMEPVVQLSPLLSKDSSNIDNNNNNNHYEDDSCTSATTASVTTVQTPVSYVRVSTTTPPTSGSNDTTTTSISKQRFLLQKTTRPPRPSSEIEVSPGVYLPLYGARETISALEEGRLNKASCMVCELALQTIDLADYVVCPICKVVSPIDQGGSSSSTGKGAVGLGMQA